VNVATNYVACYAFEKRRAPMAPLGPEDLTTVHVGQPGFFSLGYTLCGRKVSRRKSISSVARLLARAANDAGKQPPVPVNFPARR
jgi:hypothetical protein